MELRTEIEIAASPSRVWEILTDFPAYPSWNPFIGVVSGRLAVGARLKLEVAPAAGRSMTLKARVETVEPEAHLAWRVSHMPIPGLLEGVHFFKLTPTERGTRLVQGEDFSGLLVKSTGSSLTAIARAFVAMNEALRTRATRVDVEA
jgi:hypothetical protein